MSGYEGFQNTGIKWMASIPSHWDIKRLKSIFQIRKEKNDPVITKNILSLTAKQGVIPYAEKEDKGGNKPKENLTDYFIAHEGDLLVNCMNVVSGAAGVSKYFGAVSPVYYPLYPRKDDNVWYYHHVFRLITFQRSLVGLGKGIMMHESENGTLTTVRKRISMDSLGNVLLPIPPREEQDQIVRYLDWKVSEINKLIVAKRKEIVGISEIKKAIVSEAVTHGLHKGVQMKFSGVDWLGDIPAHWTTVKLRRILHPFSEKNHPELPLLSVVREQGVIIRDVEDKETNHNYIPDDLSGYKLVKKGQFAMNKMKAWQGSYGVSDYTGIVSPAYFVFDIDFENLQYFYFAIRSNKFAIIIDEAHSGQSGKNSAQMNFAISGLASDDELDNEDKINKLMEGRKLVSNASYFAFTATPKNKTLETFGTPYEEDGKIKHRPCHCYTMKQAIEEGFILDVLKYYTPISSYYRLMKTVQDDPMFDKKKAQKRLRTFVESDKFTIAQKAEMMVTHFHEQVIAKHKIDGQARAMVVTSSIPRCIEYYFAINKALSERNSPYKTIIAFSGEHKYEGREPALTSADLNGFPDAKIPKTFKNDPYRFLIVADMFQTGFDEPLLHTMYVDTSLLERKFTVKSRVKIQVKRSIKINNANETDEKFKLVDFSEIE